MTQTYQPIDSKLRCEWLDCYAGMGLAGMGWCFAGGLWWHPSCPGYQSEDEYLKEWEQREEGKS